ncbi:protein phosphatase 2C domain-containing protein [Streptomyces sp. NPDC053069]|uniref:protein phosphatase 2C domain-containing protein n=1 Tax=Streptomyces sp. NPDC053069 TaxID=3365695 RepID=UPI0037D09436
MSQQGGRPARPEDDWWGQLYDDSTEDTGPTAAADSLDDRFASAKRTLTGRPGTAAPREPGPGTRGGTAADAVTGADAPDRGDTSGSTPPGRTTLPPPRTPWEPPPAHQEPPRPTHGQPPTEPPAQTLTASATSPNARPPQAPPAPSGPQDLPAPCEHTAQDQAPVPLADPLTGRHAEDAPETAPPPEPEAPSAPSSPPAGRTGHNRAPASPAAPPADWSAQDAPETAPPTGPQSLPAPAPPPEPQDLPAPASPPEPQDWPVLLSSPHAPPADTTSDPSGLTLPAPSPIAPPPPPSSLDYVGSGPPTYDPEPTALPVADPEGLGELVADTVLDGARYGACALRAVSLRGDSARYRGEPRRDSLLTARFGTGEHALLLVAMATGVRGTPVAHLAAAEACRWIGRAVGRSHHRLVADIRAARRGDLKAGLHRLTDRSLGKLRASAVEQGVDPEEYTAGLRCLLLPADPDCRTRVFFGVGDGGLFRLRDGEWQDIEPGVTPDDNSGAPAAGFGSPSERSAKTFAETPEGDRLTMDLGIPTPPSPYEPAPEPPREPFRFRASVARPGDALVMCTAGLADPLRGEAALCAYLARRWSGRTPPGLAAFLADAQVRVKGYADDRTAAAVWEA